MGRITRTKSDLAYVESASTGQKRKRTASATTTTGSLKRRKGPSPDDDEDSQSSQDIDESSQGGSADSPESKEHGAEDDDCRLPIYTGLRPLMVTAPPADEFLLNYASKWQLQKLRREDLVRLYGLARLDDDTAELTKTGIVRQIISTRPGRSSTRQSSQTSSSHRVEATDEEATEEPQAGPSRNRSRTTLARRQTENFPSHLRLRGIPATRSASLGNLLDRTFTKLPVGRSRCVTRSMHPICFIKHSWA